MSCANRTTDNKHINCPPRMDDGRHFTDYRSNCHFNNLVRANNTVRNSHDYRMFLTSNARGLIELNRSYAGQRNGCGPRPNGKKEVSTMVPEQSIQICTNNSCNIEFVNKNGIGLGRKYSDSSPDCQSLKDYMPINQPYNCSADNGKPFNYVNQIDSKAEGFVNNPRTVKELRVPAAYNL